MLKKPFNVMPLTMKATAVSCVVHRFSINLSKHSLNKFKVSFNDPVSKNNTSFWICIEVHVSIMFPL